MVQAPKREADSSSPTSLFQVGDRVEALTEISFGLFPKYAKRPETAVGEQGTAIKISGIGKVTVVWDVGETTYSVDPEHLKSLPPLNWKEGDRFWSNNPTKQGIVLEDLDGGCYRIQLDGGEPILTDREKIYPLPITEEDAESSRETCDAGLQGRGDSAQTGTQSAPLNEEVESAENQALNRFLERRAQQPEDVQVMQERLEFISPKDIDLERGSQTRASKNRGLKDIKEKMSTPGLWRFDDPNDCPLLIELVKDELVKLKDREPFWVRAGEIIPCIGHTRIESGQELQEIKTDLKMLCRIRKGTWFDVILLGGTSDVNSAHPKTSSDRSNAAYRFIEVLFDKYGSLINIPRRGKGKPKAGEPEAEEEWGSAKLSAMFGVCANTINKFYNEIEFLRIVAPFPDGTRVQLTQNPDPTLPYFLKDKLGALGVVSGTVPNEGLFVRFDYHNPECVHPRFLALSDAPLPPDPIPEPSIGRGLGSGSRTNTASNKLGDSARSLGVNAGSQALPSSPTNLDVPPGEATAEPPTPSPIPSNTENKSEEVQEAPSLQQNTIANSSTTTDTWIPEVGEWVQIKPDAPHDRAGAKVQATCFPHSYTNDVVIIEVDGKPGRDRIETKYLQPLQEEETPKTISIQDIISEITIGVKQLSPKELSQVLVQAQPTESHKKAIKSALFKDKDADLAEAARTVVENIGRYTPEKLEEIERAIASIKSAQTN